MWDAYLSLEAVKERKDPYYLRYHIDKCLRGIKDLVSQRNPIFSTLGGVAQEDLLLAVRYRMKRESELLAGWALERLVSVRTQPEIERLRRQVAVKLLRLRNTFEGFETTFIDEADERLQRALSIPPPGIAQRQLSGRRRRKGENSGRPIGRD